jgi:hypothetical protein
MNPLNSLAAAIGLLIGLIMVICAAWWRWVEAPSRRHDIVTERPGRHAGQLPAGPASGATDLDSWREDWTDEELGMLHDDTTGTPEPLGTWDFAGWEIEQSNYRIEARRAAQAQQDALTSGAWADPWWIRRH